jgi:hypothetical protein
MMVVQQTAPAQPADPAVEDELDRLATMPIARLRVRYREVLPRASDEAKPANADLAQDPLSNADRLEITYARQEILPAVHPTEPFVPAVSSTTLPIETKMISRHWHDPNAATSPPPRLNKQRQTSTNKSKSSTAKAVRPRMVLNQQFPRSLAVGPAPLVISQGR